MQLSEALDQIDGMFDLVNTLIVQNHPDATEKALSQLRDGIQAFSGLAQRCNPQEFTTDGNLQRMLEIQDRLSQIRSYISKMSAITSQQLNTIIPEHNAISTYGGTKQPGSAASVARMYHVSG